MPSPLAKRLQIKPGHTHLVINPPNDYEGLLGEIPPGVKISSRASGTFDVVHLFVANSGELNKNFDRAVGAVKEGGILWVSYPKKTSGVETDLSRDEGWKAADDAGWGPVSMVSVDQTWSAVRLKQGVGPLAERLAQSAARKQAKAKA
jgi:hypothetical protein